MIHMKNQYEKLSIIYYYSLCLCLKENEENKQKNKSVKKSMEQLFVAFLNVIVVFTSNLLIKIMFY